MSFQCIGWFSEEHAKKNNLKKLCTTNDGERRQVTYFTRDINEDPRMKEPLNVFTDWIKIGPIREICYEQHFEMGKWRRRIFYKSGPRPHSSPHREKMIEDYLKRQELKKSNERTQTHK
jgi:hypothetical protein